MSYDGYDEISAEMTVSNTNIYEVELPEGFSRQDWCCLDYGTYGRDINIELRRRIMAGPKRSYRNGILYSFSKISLRKNKCEPGRMNCICSVADSNYFMMSMDEDGRAINEEIIDRSDRGRS